MACVHVKAAIVITVCGDNHCSILRIGGYAGSAIATTPKAVKVIRNVRTCILPNRRSPLQFNGRVDAKFKLSPTLYEGRVAPATVATSALCEKQRSRPLGLK